jgi:hypothetical protein
MTGHRFTQSHAGRGIITSILNRNESLRNKVQCIIHEKSFLYPPVFGLYEQ